MNRVRSFLTTPSGAAPTWTETIVHVNTLTEHGPGFRAGSVAVSLERITDGDQSTTELVIDGGAASLTVPDRITLHSPDAVRALVNALLGLMASRKGAEILASIPIPPAATIGDASHDDGGDGENWTA